MSYQKSNRGSVVFLSFNRVISRLFLFSAVFLSLFFSIQVFAETNTVDGNAPKKIQAPTASSVDSAVNEASERSAVLKSFVGSNRGELIASYDEQKEQHQILFYMGVTLLLFVFLTAGYGVAMGMLGKEVFVQHMVCAGITVFLAVAHSIVAIVWFFPF